MLSLQMNEIDQSLGPSPHVRQKRQRIAAPVNTLYSEADFQLLKYYGIWDQTKLQDIILLHPDFESERLAESFLPKHYLNPQEREKYRVIATGEQFIDKNDYTLEGEYIYALLPDNRLYCAPIGEVRNHSHLVAGMPVKAVGHAYFSDGKLMTLSNNSGHYKPTPKKMLSGLQWFIDNTDSTFLFEDHSNFDVSKPYFGIQHFRIEQSSSVEDFCFENPLNFNDILSILNENIYGPLKKTTSSAQLKKNGYDIDINSKSETESLSLINEMLLQYTGLNREAAESRFTGKRKQHTVKA